MLESLLNKTIELKKKQKEILYLSTKSGNKITNLKIHRELSPLGWHIMHCLYIEAICTALYPSFSIVLTPDTMHSSTFKIVT